LPAAAQVSGVAHDTPPRELLVPLGLGLFVTDQEPPFSDSMSVLVTDPLVSEPTATQLVLVHDTPLSWSDELPGLTLLTNFHVLPFQDSMRVVVSPPVWVLPAALH